ncbi:MAG: WD40 repeat domain-containing protein, partial [Alphaproteobacteria bacterium]|nr:WD40 repeat domain-containing protein [Alphaproteobacteria bacterium]
LWRWQTHRQLTHVAYKQIGQVKGALAKHADQVFGKLSKSEQTQARRVFVQLVHPGAGTEDTRRIARRTEFDDADWALVQQLADARTRLLITDQPKEDDETAELIHEALIQRWGQLKRWMNADRTFRLWQERLRLDIERWEANEQDADALLRGTPLAEAEGWLTDRTEELNEAEIAYVQSGIHFRDQRAAEREAQRQRELEAAESLASEQQQRAEAEARNSRRTRRFTFALGAALIMAIAAVVFALYQAQLAQARSLAGQAQGTFAREDYYLTLLLALEAKADFEIARQTDDSLADDSKGLLSTIPFQVSGSGVGFLGHSDWVWSVAWSPDGQLASGSDDGTVILWNTDTGQPAQTLSGHSGTVLSVAWSPDGQLASGSDDGTVILWNTDTGQPAQTLSGHSDWVRSV